jgi:hypothetical protein
MSPILSSLSHFQRKAWPLYSIKVGAGASSAGCVPAPLGTVTVGVEVAMRMIGVAEGVEVGVTVGVAVGVGVSVGL